MELELEKNVGLLRCSKLNCYAEFNKMVQSTLVHSKRLTVQNMPWAKQMLGTSAEYTFYATLLTMLQQVVSNNDAESQKQELQKVYEWFRLNKPLLRPQRKPCMKQRPRLAFTSRSSTSLAGVDKVGSHERPQTAPASFHRESGSHGSRSRPMISFTSSYVSRSLGHSLDSIGQPFDQLESVAGAVPVRPHSEGDAQSTSRSCPTTAAKFPVQVSTQAHPSPDFLTGYTPPGFGGVQPHMAESVCFGEVFSFAPPVAAQMILDKTLLPEDYKERELDYLRKRLLKSNTFRKLPKFVVVGGAQTNPTLVEVAAKSSSEDLESYSDPPSEWTFGSVPHRAHQSTARTVPGLADRNQDGVPLETIAETDSEAPSSLVANVSKEGVFITKRSGGKGRDSEVILAETLKDSPLDSRQAQRSLYQPRVLITPNLMSMSGSSRTKPVTPTRHPSIVSLTFPTDEEHQTKRTTRKPKKTLSTASTRNQRNVRTRPQTVPAMKIQSYTL